MPEILVSDDDVRRARAFLFKRNLQGVGARRLAEAAAETGKTYAETLRLLGALLMGTQGRGPAPIATEIAMAEAENGGS